MAVETYSWFLIMCSWECEDDDDAIKKFGEVYEYLIHFRDPDSEWVKSLSDKDPRAAFDPHSLKALNLIGQRLFVIIGRSRNNDVLQKLSSMITLNTGVQVDVYPATDVIEFQNIAKLAPSQ